MSSSTKAAIDFGPIYMDNLEVQEHELRGDSKFIQYHTEIGVGAF